MTSPAAIYRVVGRGGNVSKNDSGIQTDGAGGPVFSDWKQAMAHNARVLTSQEKAMDEYLKRQRLAAEQQLAGVASKRGAGTHKPPPHPSQVI